MVRWCLGRLRAHLRLRKFLLQKGELSYQLDILLAQLGLVRRDLTALRSTNNELFTGKHAALHRQIRSTHWEAHSIAHS